VYLVQHHSGLISYQALSHRQTPDERPRSANNPRQGLNTAYGQLHNIAYQDRGDNGSNDAEAEPIPGIDNIGFKYTLKDLLDTFVIQGTY